MHDVALIGGGIMSATLAVLLRRLEPDWSMAVFERLDEVADEASAAWRNAGTGHAGLCELDYVGGKAVEIAEQFQLSRQLWAGLVQDGILGAPHTFVTPMPHLAFVHGAADIEFLRTRFDQLTAHPLFRATRFSEDPAVIAEWAPLLMQGRGPGEFVAATRDPTGTDVDFGALTKQLFAHLQYTGVPINTGTEVRKLRRVEGGWRLHIRDRRTGARRIEYARFVFVGAGGWALKLLQSARAREVRGYGLMPVAGRYLRSTDPAVVYRHHAKVYGRAPVGGPPIAMPHLDARVVGGQRSVLFGPFAGFSPRLLINGGLLDAPAALRPHNLLPILSMVTQNLAPAKLLMRQLSASQAEKIAALQEFVPGTDGTGWSMILAGQRAQIVKRDPVRGGVLEFGTDVVTAENGSLAAVLGAEAGASGATAITLEVLRRCFPSYQDRWTRRLRELIPTYGRALGEDPLLAVRTMIHTAEVLRLDLPVT